MELEKLKDAELLNIAILLNDWQQILNTEIKCRPSMRMITPLAFQIDQAIQVSNRINRTVLSAFGESMAASFGEVSDDLFSKTLDLIKKHKP